MTVYIAQYAASVSVIALPTVQLSKMAAITFALGLQASCNLFLPSFARHVCGIAFNLQMLVNELTLTVVMQCGC